MRTTAAVAGHSTFSTGPSRCRVTKGSSGGRRRACRMMAPQATIMTTASQKGKKPLFGPSLPQPMPSRSESYTTSTPPSARMTAVMRSAVRMLVLQQPSLGHQLPVELLVLLAPLHVLGTTRERRLQGSRLHVVLEVRGVVHLLEEGDVPLHGLLGHVGRSEETPEHEVVEIDAQGLL